MNKVTETSQPEPDVPTNGARRDLEAGRRRLLKALGVAGGAAIISKWARPVVDTVVVPVHAQASLVLGTGDLRVTLTWNTTADVDLHVIEPGGTEVYYSNTSGPTATLDVDDTDGFGPENIFVLPGEAAVGTYQIFIDHFSGANPTTATISVTVFDNTSGEDTDVFIRNLVDGSNVNVADVTFPAGSITPTIAGVAAPRPTIVETHGTRSGGARPPK